MLWPQREAVKEQLEEVKVRCGERVGEGEEGVSEWGQVGQKVGGGEGKGVGKDGGRKGSEQGEAP